ncbi:ubl carboxyl-terminal hydrolase 18 isoform 2-T2 [Polymixia lowei]
MCRVFYLDEFINYAKRSITAMYRWCSCEFSRSQHQYSYPRHSDMRGLMNYGLSCCVNALLQSFSATWELTDLLHRWKPVGGQGDSRNVPLQLKRVLEAMQRDQPQLPHQEFLHCLDRNYIRCNIQHDADEVFHCILNFVQQQMDDKALALDIQKLYQIPVEMYLQCLECKCIQSWPSYLISLPLHLREGCNSLEVCMKSFFELQELNGSDCCFCVQCETKMPSKQRFRNIHGRTQKLDCKVTFPETFDFLEILKEEAFSKDFVKNDSKYILYAVIVHFGSAMFGHYTAYVRHKRDSWYYADDTHVKQATWEEVQETYGNYGDTAYMLLYRRRTKEEEEQPQCSG